MSNIPPNTDFSGLTMGTFSFGSQSLKIDKDVKRIRSIDELIEISDIDIVFDIIQDKMGVPSNDVINADRWMLIGFDDMDEVELIMEMEKRFDCYIDDEIANKIIEMSPRMFCQLLRSKKRDDKLNELGI